MIEAADFCLSAIDRLSSRKDVSYSELRTEVSRHLSLHCSGLYISHCNLLLKSFDRDTNFADKVKSISVDLELNDSESESRLKTVKKIMTSYSILSAQKIAYNVVQPSVS